MTEDHVEHGIESRDLFEYYVEHGIEACDHPIVKNLEIAAAMTDRISERIKNKTVVEIGGGTGLLSICMSMVAKQVVCIEADYMHANSFMSVKNMRPKNLSYIFGNAEDFADSVRSAGNLFDVAVFVSNSGVPSMKKVGARLSSTVIDIIGEMVKENPGKFDAFASKARLTSIASIHDYKFKSKKEFMDAVNIEYDRMVRDGELT